MNPEKTIQMEIMAWFMWAPYHFSPVVYQSGNVTFSESMLWLNGNEFYYLSILAEVQCGSTFF